MYRHGLWVWVEYVGTQELRIWCGFVCMHAYACICMQRLQCSAVGDPNTTATTTTTVGTDLQELHT